MTKSAPERYSVKIFTTICLMTGFTDKRSDCRLQINIFVAGSYKCIAENSEGAVESDLARLDFTGSNGAPVFLVSPQSATVRLTSNLCALLYGVCFCTYRASAFHIFNWLCVTADGWRAGDV